MSKVPELPNAMERVTDERLREALAEIKRALIERIGPDFRLILFGSRARGDADPDSDVDLMAILPDEAYTVPMREAVRSTVYNFALEYDYVFSVIVVSESIAAEHAGFMVFEAVEREGLRV